MANNQAYTSAAKTWWQQHSDELGSEMTWDSFCEVWMAALNSEGSQDVSALALPLCSMCDSKHADCAFGQLRGSQSCYDTRQRYKEAGGV